MPIYILFIWAAAGFFMALITTKISNKRITLFGVILGLFGGIIGGYLFTLLSLVGNSTTGFFLTTISAMSVATLLVWLKTCAFNKNENSYSQIDNSNSKVPYNAFIIRSVISSAVSFIGSSILNYYGIIHGIDLVSFGIFGFAFITISLFG